LVKNLIIWENRTRLEELELREQTEDVKAAVKYLHSHSVTDAATASEIRSRTLIEGF